MTIRKEERGWKTLGRKKAEILVWKIYHAIQSAKMTGSDFSQRLKDEVANHHRSWIVNPMEEVLDEICTIYKIRNPIKKSYAKK